MNEIKQGYKQTDIGVIPEDWKEGKIRNFCSMKSGNSITSERISERGEFPCYGGNGLRGYTNKFTHSGKYTLVGRQGALCGNVNYVNSKFFASEHAIVTTPFSNSDALFLAHAFERMNLNQYTESSAQPGLSVNKVLDLPFGCPPTLTEQIAIATALSDVDALIAALEKKITKKQQIKQGTMQQLLTGKKRLPGFSGVWLEKKLGEIFTILAGGDLQENFFSKEYSSECKYKVFSNSLIDNGLYGFTSNPRYPTNCVTITGRGMVGYAECRNEPFDAIVRLLVLIPSININCYLTSEIINHCINFQMESTGVPQLTVPKASNAEICYPETESEQTAIAQVLTDMDNEIEQLQADRNKYKQIKAGMMQQLLTGKIRING